MSEVLLVVALKTDQRDIRRRMETILAAAEPHNPDTAPCAYAKAVDDLTASDLGALAALMGWPAVHRLRIGSVVATPPEGARP